MTAYKKNRRQGRPAGCGRSATVVSVRTSGPAFNAVPFNPNAVQVTPVGNFALTFSDGNTATFSYTVNGTSQTKTITRRVFRDPGTMCM
jgi:hypothetical protein